MQTHDTPGSYDYHFYPWYSPHLVIKSMDKLVRKYGSDVETKGKFKRAREMFDTAVALLGVYEMHPDNKYHLQPNQQSASPDVVAVKLTEVPNAPVLLEVTQIEHVTMNEYSSTDNIAEFLKKTKFSVMKSYDSKTIILCVIKKKIQINRLDVASGLQQIRPKSSVYVLGKVINSDNWVIFSPYPNLIKPVFFNIGLVMKKYIIPEYVNLNLGVTRTIKFTKAKTGVVDIENFFCIGK